ncbi:MAG: hypothetical protein UV05_C0003G0004 [candidate division CPR1 bacterium GW2011_GWA2_42_17]|uniref:NYN domain-containing protein n=1 Tax=candidate division CPR1 bacterium GW2011_GWA2_42_17 TaxID=1618341 RepID=A0A0G0Z7E2_9BACT|nr:MAG: hypothetical protein UV05_C0003G0004 [candidate division CPR1 bacterium GW2011_GWA2_42_17]
MSVIKHSDQRVAVLMDISNLYHSAKNLYGARVNFGKVLKEAVGPRKLIRAIAYVIRTESGEEKQFFEALQQQGIEIKAKDLQIFPGGMKKGDWDVGMALDAMGLSKSMDAIILMTGDGDFVPLITYMKANSGAQVEIVTFGQSASAKLIEAADDFMDLSVEKEKFLIISPKSRAAPRAGTRAKKGWVRK